MEEKYEKSPEKGYASYGISKRNPLMWAAVLFVVLSIAARAVFNYSKETRGMSLGENPFAWIALVLTAVFGLWFIYSIVKDGGTRLYKTAKPAFVFAALLAFRAIRLYAIGDGRLKSVWLLAALIASYLLLFVLYRRSVNTGGRKIEPTPRKTLALIALIIAAAASAALDILPKTKEKIDFSLLDEASLMLGGLALIITLLGTKKNVSDRPLPMAGDRRDGRRIRSLDPMNAVAVYVMPDRTASSNLFSESFECSKTEEYIREKREQGLEHFGYTHIFLAAYARTVAQRPGINRFISGQRTYTRGDRIEIAMAIKKDMSLEGSETIVKIALSPEDTPEKVYEKFNKEVEAVKSTSELDTSFDKLAGLFNLIPGVLMKFTVWLIKTADYFGVMPDFITRISPFHGTIFVTSMGSLGIRPIYHHLYDFGNIPVFLAFGMKRRENEVKEDGSVVQKRYIDFTVNTDERICDGFYYASAFKIFKRCLTDPKRLDIPPEEIISDVE